MGVTSQEPWHATEAVRPGGRPGPVRTDADPPSGCRYRKLVSNVCEGGVDPRQSPVRLQCPLLPPRGLQVSIRGAAVAVRPGEDVLFVVQQEQVRGRFGWADGAVGGILSPSKSWSAESSGPAFPNCGR